MVERRRTGRCALGEHRWTSYSARPDFRSWQKDRDLEKPIGNSAAWSHHLKFYAPRRRMRPVPSQRGDDLLAELGRGLMSDGKSYIALRHFHRVEDGKRRNLYRINCLLTSLSGHGCEFAWCSWLIHSKRPVDSKLMPAEPCTSRWRFRDRGRARVTPHSLFPRIEALTSWVSLCCGGSDFFTEALIDFREAFANTCRREALLAGLFLLENSLPIILPDHGGSAPVDGFRIPGLVALASPPSDEFFDLNPSGSFELLVQGGKPVGGSRPGSAMMVREVPRRT